MEGCVPELHEPDTGLLKGHNVGMKKHTLIFLILLGMLSTSAVIYLWSNNQKIEGVNKILVESNADPKSNIVECKKIPIETQTKIEAVNETFNPDQPPEGQKFYKHSTNEDVWTEASFDVDQDSIPERILTANTAMNHTPHVLRIVKDSFVVFKYEGAGVYAEQAENNDGFILMETIDWNKNIKRQTRYDYEAGKFIPVWYQENCNE